MMISAAISIRRMISHSGVRAGVSSWRRRASSSLSGGKTWMRGAGGVMRNSHHSTGSVANAVSIHGAAKASGPICSTAQSSTPSDSAA